MILQVFCIHDVKADIFMTPFFKRTKGEAIRDFTELSNDPQGLVFKYPGDFRLVQVGTFDDSNGSFENQSVASLGFGSDFQKPVPKQLELVPEVSRG